MTTITFDTHKFIKTLQEAGFEQKQAEAVLRVISESQDALVTRDYLDHKLEKELAPVRTDLAVLKWMMGFIMAGIISLVLKTFF
ncbi:DUF1640 domain-containing protein [Candidatus Methylospira mobilis]|uniref:DUF1640 domain-containing protein n=1 Tax=Candidatus Methylospira mobilis TaxID=1808979 RepID=UPI0028EF8FDF|nr:DUF1640 domain-containing protein [Candidatus Methylospira mobilis]WNV05904.1 DUF1640 domain-containing protein [Candidatus Methylospira mobilis]